jgi:hypothetical protein
MGQVVGQQVVAGQVAVVPFIYFVRSEEEAPIEFFYFKKW